MNFAITRNSWLPENVKCHTHCSDSDEVGSGGNSIIILTWKFPSEESRKTLILKRLWISLILGSVRMSFPFNSHRFMLYDELDLRNCNIYRGRINFQCYLSRFLVLISFCLSLTYAAAEISNSNMCPMDLSYVLRIPWNRTLCQDFNPPAQNDNTNTTSKLPCCQTLLSLNPL